MRLLRLGTAAAFAMSVMAPLAAAQQGVHVEGNQITVRGCVAASSAQPQMTFDTLVWSHSGILTAGAGGPDTPVRTGGQDLAARVLYWLDEDDLAEHTGKLVELRGELGDLEKGELKVERDGDFTEIRLELDGDEETIRVPTSWLPRSSVARTTLSNERDGDAEIELATRKIDVDDVKVLGPCPGQ
jgi:hypothetical protein